MLEYDKKLKSYARDLRKNQTEAESFLWRFLRRKQLHNISFYRQKPLGPYIVDFYAPRVNLAIELDGSQHYEEENQEYDKKRDAYLKSLGIKVLRFNNIEVLKGIEMVLKAISLTIEEKEYTFKHGLFYSP